MAAMKYLWRLLLYLLIFSFMFTAVSVLLLKFVPVTITPLKVIRLIENLPEEGFSVKSDWCPLTKISGEMIRAVITTEDNHFLTHHGFDFNAIQQAIEENREGRRLRGASTISQQTAKNVFCFPQQSWVRKGIETWFTVWIEFLWSKQRIMEVYLNVIETHENVYGVEATAEIFYKKPALDLNRYEAAMIATVLPNPRRMNIGAPSNYMVRRAGQVRNLMGKLGPIDFDNPTERK